MKKIVGISGQLGSGKDSAADRLVDEFGFVKVALADPLKRYAFRVFDFTEQQLWGPSEFRNTPDGRSRFHTWWADVTERAAEYNPVFVEELFPEEGDVKTAALEALEGWLKLLATEHPRLSPRVMLQSLGTEWGRTVKSDIWISHAIEVSEYLLEGGLVYDRLAGLFTSEASDPPSGVVISDVRFHNELERIKEANGFLIRIKRPDTDNRAGVTGIEGHPSEKQQKSFDDELFNYVIVNDGTLDRFIADIDTAGFVLTGRAK